MRKLTQAELEQAQAKLLEAARGIMLVASPIRDSKYVFEKEYQGMFKVHGNRLEDLQDAINEVIGVNS